MVNSKHVKPELTYRQAKKALDFLTDDLLDERYETAKERAILMMIIEILAVEIAAFEKQAEGKKAKDAVD